MSELFNTLGAWPHILQSEPWAAFKARWGWRRVDAPSGVSLIARTVRPLPFPILYAPKGPNIVWQDEGAREQTLSALENLARAHRALFVKIDPDVPAAQNAVRDALTRRGWRFSPEQIQYRNTFLLDLRPGEDDLLAG
ncbi:MAG: peptidoglycan bridge formation glycyltransferase FemA/FemB family protein, partial [Chloroflexi bacterium]|nr:peptidoglycan bridge formation glycyltransferase FemA/FemB family protein [Chloroflexota bacterium]